MPFESLERRTLLCATAADMLASGVPADMISDSGHLTYADYMTLAPELRAHIDPHLVESETPIVMDFDQMLGIPAHVEGRGGPEGESLPDFFPQLDSSIILDQTTQPGRVLLRFGTQVNNQGAGPGIFISGRPGIDPIPTGAPITSWVNPDGSQNVLQAVYHYNGSSFSLSHYLAGGRFTYHAGHGHFHFDGYAEFSLRHNVGGQPGGYVQRPDGLGAVGAKTGFCLINTSSSFTTESGDSSTLLPGYGAPGQPATGCGFLQGVRVGHADEYSSGLQGQWMDVTGVPNGQYFVEIKLDGENAMAESNENNNAKSWSYSLNVNPPGGGITPDQFDTGGNNDSFANAVNLNDLGAFTQTGLNIHWGQDNDFFRFTATSSGSGSITLTPASGDVNLYVYDASHTLVGSSTSSSGTETVTYNFVEGQTYYVQAQSYNGTTSNNYQIAWNIKPAVNAAATDAVANELGGNSGIVAIGRNGPTTSPLTVNFTVSGSATRGVDYELFHDNVLLAGNTITLGNLAQVGNVEVRPIYDNTPEPAETVIITLASGSAYVIGGNTSGTVTLGDAGPEVAQATQVWQTSPHKLIFAIDRAAESTLQLSDFAVLNLGTNQPVVPQSFAVEPSASGATVTLTFAGALPDGRYRATVLGAGIANAQGDVMFGDFVYNFFTMTADANHDGRVNLDDFNILAQNFGQSPRDASQGDFNYDGLVNLDDFNILSARFGTVLPAARGNPTGLFNGGKGISDDDEGLGELA